MKNLLNPKWLIVINTIPIIALFIILGSQFLIIKSLLKEENIILWKLFALALFILGILNLGYSLFSVKTNKEITSNYCFVALVVYITFLVTYGFYSNDIIPFDLPRWMINTEFFIYLGMFIMPTLAHSLLVLVVKFTSDKKEYNPLLNALYTVLIPISWYLISQIIQPLFKQIKGDFVIHIVLVFCISGTLLFLFFLIRTIHIIAQKNTSIWSKYELFWKIPFTIVFPIIGLLVNSGRLFDYNLSNSNGFFGDFSNYWFYIIALINGILLCLPKQKNNTIRLVLFGIKSITFTYTLYFFLVFLPYLPVSVIAVIAIGVGFLLLSPLVLFVIHCKDLVNDYNFLSTVFSKRKLVFIQITGILTLPIFITISNIHHKLVLNETLDYVYNPDYSKEYNIPTTSILSTLNIVSKQKERTRDSFLFGQTPFLSSYFNWIVLDNMTLSDKKINKLQTIFDGETNTFYNPANNITETKNVVISNVTTQTKFDKNKQAWISWIDFELTNTSGNLNLESYLTNFDLPSGCYISDYYLYVGEKKEKGLLAEKKAAQWVFSQIENENRDPGILYYNTNNNITFKVFPFLKKEKRRTGIEFIHKEPVEITFDNKTIKLGNTTKTIVENYKTNTVDYVSAFEKKKLKTIKRKPYYHFIVDASMTNEKYKNRVISKIETVLKSKHIDSKNAKITFANTYVTTKNLDKNWKQEIENKKFSGGFYLDRAIKKILFTSYIKKENSYPVIIVTSDNINNVLLENDLANFEMAFPENDTFFCIDSIGKLKPHSLITNPNIELKTNSISFENEVLAYPNPEKPITFLRNNNKADVVLKQALFEFDETKTTKNWVTAINLEANSISQVLYPSLAEKHWLKAIKQSFISKIMIPQTSYIVVENEAQKAMILKKQQEVLSGNKALDLDEDTQGMSEPNLLIVIGLLMILFFVKNRKKIII